MNDLLKVIMDQPAHLSVADQGYMPRPNLTCVILTDMMPPANLTTTGFLVLLTDDDHVILANELQRARLEIPGGHIDPGENAIQAAIREAYEEVGVVATDVKPIGYLRQVIHGEKPDGYQYPYPISFQQFFMGKITRIDPYEPNEECGMPAIMRLDDAMDILDPRHVAFIKEAVRLRDIETHLQPSHLEICTP
jgi:8-oxo-dGTP pyrophosphatase MutT (NUDIX family)